MRKNTFISYMQLLLFTDCWQAPPSQKVTPEPKIARSTSSVSLTTTASSVVPKSLASSFDHAADDGVAITSSAGFYNSPTCIYHHYPLSDPNDILYMEHFGM